MDVCIKVPRLCKQVCRNLGTASKLLLDLAAKCSPVEELAKHGSGMQTTAVGDGFIISLNFVLSDAFSARARAEPDR